jgi:hypothetical protein
VLRKLGTARAVRGMIAVSPTKSISHRAAILNGIAEERPWWRTSSGRRLRSHAQLLASAWVCGDGAMNHLLVKGVGRHGLREPLRS